MQTIPLQSTDQPADITVLEESRGLVVRILTNITVKNAGAIRTAVLSAWEKRGNPQSVILDLGQVNQIDSTGLAMLLELAQKAKSANLPFILCGLQESPRRVLARTGLGPQFAIAGTVEEALLGRATPGVVSPSSRVGQNVLMVDQPIHPSGRRRLDLLEEDEARSHKALWAVVVVLAAGMIAAGVYGYSTFETYRGRLDQLPVVQSALAMTGSRIAALEEALRNWSSQRDAWTQRLTKMEAQFDTSVRAARKQAEEIVARSQGRMQADLDRRTQALQARLDGIQSAQQSADARLTTLKDQLDRIQQASAQEVGHLREEVSQERNADRANLNRQVARVDQQADQGKRDLEAVHRKVDRERIDFELGVNHSREVAPGINLEVSRTNVSFQRFDGRVWLMPDRRTLRVHGQGLQQPLVFYSQKDERPRELVITRVTKYSVVGYVMLPRDGGLTDGATGGMASRDRSSM